MIRERRIAINRIAEEVRRVLAIDPNETKVELEDIIEHLGGEIVYDVMSLDDAFVLKDSPNSFKIVVDKWGYDTRNRFSIAHELGHLFLHMQYLINDEVWNSIEVGKKFSRQVGRAYSEIEEDANEFAGAFLMPKEIFLKTVEELTKGGYCNTQEVAKVFGVSADCVNIRGRKLNVWE